MLPHELEKVNIIDNELTFGDYLKESSYFKNTMTAYEFSKATWRKKIRKIAPTLQDRRLRRLCINYEVESQRM